MPSPSTLLRWPMVTAIFLLLVLSASAPVGAFTPDQVDKGRELFRLQCARCHGPDGQGIANIYKSMTAPELIGATALPLNPRPYQKMRHFQFRNVRDVYEFISAVMPADQPASLSVEDYWNVLAFLLNANGMPIKGQPLTENEAAQIPLTELHGGTQPKGGPPPDSGQNGEQ